MKTIEKKQLQHIAMTYNFIWNFTNFCKTNRNYMSWNKFDSKAGTTARAIETLMGQYFD